MPVFLIRRCAYILCRVTRLRTWRIVVAILMLVFSLYMLKLTSRTKRNIAVDQEDDIDDGISNRPVDRMFKKLEESLVEKQESSTNSSSLPAAKCRLPVLDPFHSSVKNMIVDLGKLDCGTTHSKFENNTLTVEAQDAVSVSYRIISRPKGNDFECSLLSPIALRDIRKGTGANVSESLSPGKAGCLMHVESKKCLHPFGGKSNPKDGTPLVFHSDCCFHRIKFKMNADRSIQHIPSGLCVHVDNKTVTLQSSCSTKFKVSVIAGVLQVPESGLCIQQKDVSKAPDDDENVSSGKTCTQLFNFIQTKGKAFHASANLDADFVRVDIKRSAGKNDITEVHMQTAPKPEALKRKVKHSGIPVNIAMIMFDSTSAANFIRKMPKTNSYLKTRPTVFMKGNTIVGDGTVAQLSAMLTGIPEEEQPEARRSKPNAKIVDDWKWVFRDYQQRGYVTMYSEDSPGVGAFNYRLKGFKNPPTDHYGRYFWMEAHRHGGDHCAGNDAMHRLTFNYFLSLFRTYHDHPKFSLLVFSDLTHDNINAIKYADDDLHNLLQTMERESYLDDTIIFIFGDHGLRFGKMRKTLQGKLEERLPHMSITFPTWFPKKHPKLYKTVQQNSNLLTTPFDIYETLQHVLTYPLPPKGARFGQSLFVPINPQNRTCASTGVEDHWCPCMNFEKVSVDSRVVKRLANFAVQFINKLLEKESKVESLCHKLSLKVVKTALREMPNENVQKFKHSYKDHRCDSCGVILGDKDQNTLTQDTLYQIQLVTSPNDGFFEASIKLHRGEPSIKGSISRVDTYGHQPDCIKDTYVHLLKYCYCKINS